MSDVFLVIDDNEEYLELVKDYCLKQKFRGEIKYFEDALEAMNYIDHNKKTINTVFTDYNMKAKGMSGKIIVEKCKESKVPVVIVSSETRNLAEANDCLVIDKTSSLSWIMRILKGER